MGSAAFEQLWDRREQFELVLLLRPSHRKRFAPLVAQGLTVVWGDATNLDDVRAAIRGSDVVLSAMALNSPTADYHPDEARRVNVDAVANIITAIGEEPDGLQRIRFVHTSTVALTGNRQPPIHWGRVGDPLNPSIYDSYALTKMTGERTVLESGIRHAAVMRMTFIMPTDFVELLKMRDPILFHMPVDTHMENISADDAGLAMANAAALPAASPFWGRVYNVGGGPGMRITARRYQDVALQLAGMRGIRYVAKRNWFATRNFHMQYFLDSDAANELLHYQRDDLDSYLAKVTANMPWWGKAMRVATKLSVRIPPTRWITERATAALLGRMATKHRNGPGYWIENNVEPRIDAFFGGLAEYRQIPDWDAEIDEDPPSVPIRRGYDDTKSTWDIADLRAAAEFRGGHCHSSDWDGDRISPIDWECARGHRFSARPNTVLHAGHWCPDCAAPPWRPAEEARLNPFFAQVWPYGAQADVRQEYKLSEADDIIDADR